MNNHHPDYKYLLVLRMFGCSLSIFCFLCSFTCTAVAIFLIFLNFFFFSQCRDRYINMIIPREEGKVPLVRSSLSFLLPLLFSLLYFGKSKSDLARTKDPGKNRGELG